MILNKMKLSIIIPTKNESFFLPQLLKSIIKQNINYSYEIIISDAKSEDKTLKIAKEYWCKICNWWIPSIWRNNGAKIAKWKYLIFLDADSILEKNSLNIWIDKILFSQKKICTPYINLRNDENNFIAKIYYLFTIVWYRLGCVFWCCIIIEKKLFQTIGGFNENIYLLEDVELIKRARKFSERINTFPFCFTSSRRFKKIWTFKMIFYTTWLYILSIFWVYNEKNENNFNIYKL